MSGDRCNSIVTIVEIQENGIIRMDNIIIGRLTDYAQANFKQMHTDMVNKSIEMATKLVKGQINSIYGLKTLNDDFRDDSNREGQDSYFGRSK